MKRYRFLSVALSVLFVLSGCHHPDNPQPKETQVVVDDYGQNVEVPLHPRRVVSVSPAITEILFAIGADSLLVGRTDYCDYPREASHIESIGGISNLNVEKVLSLNPDLVISGSMVGKKTVLQFAKMGVPVVCVVEKNSFEGLYDNILMVGKLTDHSQEAQSLVARLREQVPQFPADPAHIPSCYYVVGYGNGGNYTAGGNTYITDIIALAGGRNIARDMKGWNYSLEALLQEDPDYIIIRREDSATFVRTHPYDRLSAVRQGRVIGIESGTIDLQVPRNIDAIRYLSSRLH